MSLDDIKPEDIKTVGDFMDLMVKRYGPETMYFAAADISTMPQSLFDSFLKTADRSSISMMLSVIWARGYTSGLKRGSDIKP